MRQGELNSELTRSLCSASCSPIRTHGPFLVHHIAHNVGDLVIATVSIPSKASNYNVLKMDQHTSTKNVKRRRANLA